ncbi:Mrp/NBP35 family ATP-binding protein [Phenylobacterium montanum]|uniref:Iron-sulfur cluster carrier protein n=1 Tax=Phenylobacterium montanum TaxID=2823693 RepID=A0A975G3I3_9CAUL|nr:Mrp/NBP35 family ATP-binding protein [Caulobacter sp. S6]QUD90006.1 Mrp/NBP35 family ATP-binding protein [Caulobacter sp. S6]
MTDPVQPDRGAVLAALETVPDPKSGRGLVSAGLVQALVVRPGRAGFMLEVPGADVGLYGATHEAAEAALLKVPGVEKAQVVLTTATEVSGPQPGPPSEPFQAPGTVRVRRGARLSNEAQAQAQPPAQQPSGSMKPAHVRHVVAVASGKGGVGKSTVAVNLAAAMALLGRRVGLLDADVYGPSVPRMTGVDAEPEMTANKKLKPLEAWGLKVMSIGFLVDEAAPMIWRGPMASSALNQMLNDVAWGSEAEPLDILVIDMPPGTGDIQLTLAQRVALSGAVVVSTPQEVALIDVRRGVSMFEKTRVPILGVIENMAFFPDPVTGAPIPIFGHGGARSTAEALGAPFLGEIPIEVALREACDAGAPLVAQGGDSAAARAFLAIAGTVLEQVEAGEGLKAPPRIVIED